MTNMNWKIVAGVGCASLAAAGTGYLLYLLGQKSAHSDKRLPSTDKTYENNDPINLYVIDHTTINPVLKKLHKLSTSHSKGIMTTAIEQDTFLTILTKSLNAKKAIDIGMFFGCRAMALALGLSDGGKVVGLEINSEYIENGKPFFAEAGISDKIDIRIKDAEEGLSEMIKDGESGTYDIAFLDAFNKSYPSYLEPVYTLLCPEGLFVIDNALQGGKVVDPQVDKSVNGVFRINDMLKNDCRFEVVLLKVADGIMIARKI
ncbi:probable caffeoyl-CoA O-methyltransferase 2 [Dysidea avara]|uniref:probable caffeoyl-CoA O-methyltransferase 2 n=1 Tax=Dysidea avara TaxID=196820 RepID=UPI00332DE9E6